jgi:hypothetical protein
MFFSFLFSWLIFFDTGLQETVTVIYTVDNFALNLNIGSIPFMLLI